MEIPAPSEECRAFAGVRIGAPRRWTVQSLPRVDLARPEQQLTGGIILSGPEVSSGTEVVDAVTYDALAVWAWELAEMLHRREVARGYAESVHSDPFDQCGARLCRETRSQCEAT